MAYEHHHGVSYSEAALRTAALVGTRHPCVSNDPLQTAHQFIDEAGAMVRTRRLVGHPSEELQDVVDIAEVLRIASKLTGISIEKLLEES